MVISRDNKVINEIMATPSPAAILLTKSDGENIGFLSELSNFYKHTFWFNAEYDNAYSFAVEMARKIFADDEASLNKIIQYKHCEYSKDNVIINEILNKIASLNGDCLIVMDNLELLDENFNYPLLELLLKNSPRNLKVVLVSDKFIDINYNIFSEQCPKLLDYHGINAKTESAAFENENFTYEERSFLCYISALRHVDAGFAEKIYPDSTRLLEYLNKCHRKWVFNKNGVYFFNENLSSRMLEKEPEIQQSEFFKNDINLLHVEYLMDAGKPITALKEAIKTGMYDYADEIIEKVLSDGSYDFNFADYAMANKENHDYANVGNHYGLLFLIAMKKTFSGEYNRVIEFAETIIEGCEKEASLVYYAHGIKFYALYQMGQYRKAADYAYGILEEKCANGDLSPTKRLTHIICRMPEAIKKSNIEIDAAPFRRLEEFLTNEENADEYWYPMILQTYAEIYFAKGNYGKAIKYIDKIKLILPFYAIPYILMDYYYYIGDMKYALDVAKSALIDAINHNIEADLCDVYTLLAKASMYLNEENDAKNYIENAVNCTNSRQASKFFAITIRSIICAKTGRAEYGRDIAMIYSKYCEQNSVKSANSLYGAIAYCCWRLRDYDQALIYARKCVEKASSRSGVWLMASAISVSILLESGELRNARSMVEKVLLSSVNYGMITVVADYYDCFEKIVNFAAENGILTDYLAEISEKVSVKTNAAPKENSVYVRLMGVTNVTVGGKELQWKTKKSKELFLMYVLSGEEGMERNFILSSLWNDYVYVSAINNLKTNNNIIRNVLQSAKVDFKLSYGNSKYYLSIPNMHCDYNDFLAQIDLYDENGGLGARLAQIKGLLKIYNGGFALGISNPYFNKLAAELKERLVLIVVKLVNDLLEADDFIEAKRLLSALESVGLEEEFALMVAEPSEKIKRYYEGV